VDCSEEKYLYTNRQMRVAVVITASHGETTIYSPWLIPRAAVTDIGGIKALVELDTEKWISLDWLQVKNRSVIAAYLEQPVVD
jgi:hypothetical protein